MFTINEINSIITAAFNVLNIDTGRNLMLGTAAQESMCGKYLQQIGGGPALGIWQVEPTTEKLVLKWIKNNNYDVYEEIIDIKNNDEEALRYNHVYCCIIARCLYLSIKVPLPDEHDVISMGKYWKEYYNRNGKGTVSEFVDNYINFVSPYINNN